MKKFRYLWPLTLAISAAAMTNVQEIMLRELYDLSLSRPADFTQYLSDRHLIFDDAMIAPFLQSLLGQNQFGLLGDIFESHPLLFTVQLRHHLKNLCLQYQGPAAVMLLKSLEFIGEDSGISRKLFGDLLEIYQDSLLNEMDVLGVLQIFPYEVLMEIGQQFCSACLASFASTCKYLWKIFSMQIRRSSSSSKEDGKWSLSLGKVYKKYLETTDDHERLHLEIILRKRTDFEDCAPLLAITQHSCQNNFFSWTRIMHQRFSIDQYDLFRIFDGGLVFIPLLAGYPEEFLILFYQLALERPILLSPSTGYVSDRILELASNMNCSIRLMRILLQHVIRSAGPSKLVQLCVETNLPQVIIIEILSLADSHIDDKDGHNLLEKLTGSISGLTILFQRLNRKSFKLAHLEVKELLVTRTPTFFLNHIFEGFQFEDVGASNLKRLMQAKLNESILLRLVDQLVDSHVAIGGELIKVAEGHDYSNVLIDRLKFKNTK